MNTELNTLKSLSVEELEYYLGVMANPDVPTTGFEIPGAYHRRSNSMHEFSQEKLGTSEFRGIESLPDLPGRTEHLSTSEIIASGKSFFATNKAKIKRAVCTNKTIQERVLSDEKPDLDWLIDRVVEELSKEFKLASIARAFAVYVCRIGIKKLCD